MFADDNFGLDSYVFGIAKHFDDAAPGITAAGGEIGNLHHHGITVPGPAGIFPVHQDIEEIITFLLANTLGAVP